MRSSSFGFGSLPAVVVFKVTETVFSSWNIDQRKTRSRQSRMATDRGNVTEDLHTRAGPRRGNQSQTFLTIWTMSSSCKRTSGRKSEATSGDIGRQGDIGRHQAHTCNICSLPTRWGRCFALAPHTSAYLNCLIIALCNLLQKYSTVQRSLGMTTGSCQSGSRPFGFV